MLTQSQNSYKNTNHKRPPHIVLVIEIPRFRSLGDILSPGMLNSKATFAIQTFHSVQQ